MNLYTSIYNIGLFILIGFAIYFSSSLMPLWGLLLVGSYSGSNSEKEKKK